MGRLTFDGLFCDIAMCKETPGGTFCEDGACSQRKVWERLKEYEDLEKKGSLLVLPCKVGDTVFGIVRYGRHSPCVVEGEVKEMYFANEDMRLCIVVKGACRGEWGKVIFGSREEAERALEGGNGDG